MKKYQKNLLGILLLVGVISVGLMFKPEQLPVVYKAESIIKASPSPIEKSILESFSTGAASTLSPYLGEAINFTILEEEHMYTAPETIKALQNFFQNHPPKKMIKKHAGVSKSGAGQYLIAVLTTQSGEDYRCYFFIESLKITSIEIRMNTGME
jgi:Domain of unknown function (DUF4783)